MAKVKDGYGLTLTSPPLVRDLKQFYSRQISTTRRREVQTSRVAPTLALLPPSFPGVRIGDWRSDGLQVPVHGSRRLPFPVR